MSTPLDVFGVTAPTGSKVVAALVFPSGLAAGAGTTVSGGTVTGTPTVPTSATAIYLGLAESPAGSGNFTATATIAGTALPNTTDRPYTVEARIVAGGTTMTDYTAIATAYAASVTIAYTRDVPAWMQGGMCRGGVWHVAMDPNAYDTIIGGVNVASWAGIQVQLGGDGRPLVHAIVVGGNDAPDLTDRAGANFNDFYHNANAATDAVVDDVGTGGGGGGGLSNDQDQKLTDIWVGIQSVREVV